MFNACSGMSTGGLDALPMATTPHTEIGDPVNDRHDSLRNPEADWMKLPQRLIVSSPFLKMAPGDRALALAVYVAGSGHAASDQHPVLDTAILPSLLALTAEDADRIVQVLITVGLWSPVEGNSTLVDTGIGAQLQTRQDARAAKSRAGMASARARAYKADDGDPFAYPGPI